MKETEAVILFKVWPCRLEIKETKDQYFKKKSNYGKLKLDFFLFCFPEFAQYYIPNVSKIAQTALTPHIKFVAGAIFSHLFFCLSKRRGPD